MYSDYLRSTVHARPVPSLQTTCTKCMINHVCGSWACCDRTLTSHMQAIVIAYWLMNFWSISSCFVSLSLAQDDLWDLLVGGNHCRPGSYITSGHPRRATLWLNCLTDTCRLHTLHTCLGCDIWTVAVPMRLVHQFHADGSIVCWCVPKEQLSAYLCSQTDNFTLLKPNTRLHAVVITHMLRCGV